MYRRKFHGTGELVQSDKADLEIERVLPPRRFRKQIRRRTPVHATKIYVTSDAHENLSMGLCSLRTFPFRNLEEESRSRLKPVVLILINKGGVVLRCNSTLGSNEKRWRRSLHMFVPGIKPETKSLLVYLGLSILLSQERAAWNDYLVNSNCSYSCFKMLLWNSLRL